MILICFSGRKFVFWAGQYFLVDIRLCSGDVRVFSGNRKIHVHQADAWEKYTTLTK